MNQAQMFYQASRHNADLDRTFLELVEDGLTREELQTNIDRRPALWGRWESWLDKLPTSQRRSQPSAKDSSPLTA